MLFAYSRFLLALCYNEKGREASMIKKEWKIEVIVKSVPHLELVPENLMEAFVTGLIENLESCSEKAAEAIELSNK